MLEPNRGRSVRSPGGPAADIYARFLVIVTGIVQAVHRYRSRTKKTTDSGSAGLSRLMAQRARYVPGGAVIHGAPRSLMS